MILIGHAGTNGSGKDTLAALLGEKYGFYVGSATEMFDQELKIRGLESNRENKRKLSAQWRRDFGLGVIVDKAVEQAKAQGFDKIVVGSLRNPGEADRVHELGGTMIWIDADPKVRYERIQKGNRGRGAEDNKTFKEFLAEEAAEMHPYGDATTLNMSAVKEKSDIFLENSSSDIKNFQSEAEKILAKYL